MKPRDANYEKVATLALKEWAAKEHPGKKITVYGKQKWRVSEAEQPEIDAAVVIEGSIKLFIIVECKRRIAPVDVGVVRQLAYLRGALHAHVAMIISTAGFQSGARRMAEEHGIKLIEQQEDQTADHWKIVIPCGIVGWVAFEEKASATEFVMPELVSPLPGAQVVPPSVIRTTDVSGEAAAERIRTFGRSLGLRGSNAVPATALSRSSGGFVKPATASPAEGATVAKSVEAINQEEKLERERKLRLLADALDGLRGSPWFQWTPVGFDDLALPDRIPKIGQDAEFVKKLRSYFKTIADSIYEEDQAVVIVTLESIAGFEWFRIFRFKWWDAIHSLHSEFWKLEDAINEILLRLIEKFDDKPAISSQSIMRALNSYALALPDWEGGSNPLWRPLNRRRNRYPFSNFRSSFYFHTASDSRMQNVTRILGERAAMRDGNDSQIAIEILCFLCHPAIVPCLSLRLPTSSSEEATMIADVFRHIFFISTDSDHQSWRARAGEALGRCLIQNQELDADARKVCLKALAEGRFPTAKEWLMQATLTDSEIRDDAIYCLAELGEESALAELLCKVGKKIEPDYRALGAFGSQKYTNATSVLERNARSVKSRWSLETYLTTLRKLDSKEVKALEELLPLLSDSIEVESDLVSANLSNPLTKAGLITAVFTGIFAKLSKSTPSRRDLLTPWRLLWNSDESTKKESK
jgi:hypothetical protein